MKKPSPKAVAPRLNCDKAGCLLCCRAGLLLIMLLPAFKTHAQDFFPEQKDYAVSVGTDLELPGKNLSDYRKAVAANVGIMRLLDRFTVGVNFSYREFSPITPVVVEQIDPAHQSTSTYSSYSTFLFYLSGAYNVSLSEKVKAYGGLNAGVGYNTSSILYQQDDTNLYFGGGVKQLYAAPKLGLSYAINNNVDVEIHAAYNLLAQTGNLTNPTTHVTRTSFSSLTTGLGLMFKF